MTPLTKTLKQVLKASKPNVQPITSGHITRMVGLTLEARGCLVKVGDRCLVQGDERTLAEVVGFDQEKFYLMPIETVKGLAVGAKVTCLNKSEQYSVGWQLVGRVIDGMGCPIDGKAAIVTGQKISIDAKPINPMARAPVRTSIDVGIRAINALLTIGQGQRLGLFAGSGVGKSILMGMMTKFTTADVVVVGLVGERGREVQEFIQDILGEQGLKRAVVVAAPADESPVMRLKAAYLSTAVAEFFRDEGKNVLFLMDSLTRFGQAQREVALAIGEPPATKGYPPSVFAKIPKLVERTGNGPAGGGSITALYTVLTEGDDIQDPIADSARAILDGHIVLSRTLAEEGHYPAIDIEASVSRTMPQTLTAQQLKQTQKLKYIYSIYQQHKDLINVGAYSPGANADLDLSLKLIPVINAFLQQSLNESFSLQESQEGLHAILNSAIKQGNQPAN